MCQSKLASIVVVPLDPRIVGVESETIRGRHWPYLITADHVIRSQVLIELDIPDSHIHGELFGSVPVEGWRQPLPEVDLAVAPFPYDRVPRYQNFLLERFVPCESVVPLGGQVLYLGIFEPAQVPMARGSNLGARRTRRLHPVRRPLPLQRRSSRLPVLQGFQWFSLRSDVVIRRARQHPVGSATEHRARES
jgi:hypothetical protein